MLAAGASQRGTQLDVTYEVDGDAHHLARRRRRRSRSSTPASASSGAHRVLTLDAMPSVVREAIEEDHLNITRQVMKREVCFLIGRGGAILWADASDSPAALPDSRARWEAIWEHRDELEVIAHSHPIGPTRVLRRGRIDDGGARRRARPHDALLRRRARASRSDVRTAATTVSPEPWWVGSAAARFGHAKGGRRTWRC